MALLALFTFAVLGLDGYLALEAFADKGLDGLAHTLAEQFTGEVTLLRNELEGTTVEWSCCARRPARITRSLGAGSIIQSSFRSPSPRVPGASIQRPP